VKILATDAEIFNNTGNDAAWHVAGVPRKGNEPVGLERI
jgi:hypothetical protein